MDSPQNALHLNFRKGAPELLEAHEQEGSWGEKKRIGKTIFCTPFLLSYTFWMHLGCLFAAAQHLDVSSPMGLLRAPIEIGPEQRGPPAYQAALSRVLPAHAGR